MSEKYNPFEDKSAAKEYYNKKIDERFDFICYEQTGFHELDIKRYEARQCVLFGLGISAIIMTAISLEECLKTILKYHFFFQKQKNASDFNLDDVDKFSREAERLFGGLTLHNAIQKARKEKIITENEENRLLDIKDYIRNAFIHSDKSKIFDDQSTTKVDMIKFDDNEIKSIGSQEMNILGLNFAQGIAQKELADEEAPRIMEEIDSIIISTCNRFSKSNYLSQ